MGEAYPLAAAVTTLPSRGYAFRRFRARSDHPYWEADGGGAELPMADLVAIARQVGVTDRLTGPPWRG